MCVNKGGLDSSANRACRENIDGCLALGLWGYMNSSCTGLIYR